MTLRRDRVKYVRDLIKRDYKLKDACYICGAKEELELHHLYSLSQCWRKWCEEQGLEQEDITEVDQIMELRVQFRDENQEELGNHNLFSLCKKHHQRLHNIYGQTYNNAAVPKIRRWLDRQKEKNIGE